MLLLQSTDTLELVTGTTGIDLDVHTDYVDLNTSTSAVTPARPANLNVLTNTTTTLVTSPAAGTVRNVKNLTISNEGSVTTTVVVQHNDGTYAAELWGASLAAGESLNMDDLGNWTYLDASGQVKVNQAIPATAWAVPGTIGSTTPNTGAFTTLSATGTVTFNMASANVSLAPTGTGTVTINPATASNMNNVNVGATTRGTGAFTTLTCNGLLTPTLGMTVTGGAIAMSPASFNVVMSPTGTGVVTISPATLGTADNMTIGGTTRAAGNFTAVGAGMASAVASTWIVAAAGTTTVAPLTLTHGTNLTTAAIDTVENDAICFYATTNTTDGRGIIPTIQQFRLTANGSAITTIANFFGTTSNVSLVASAYYEIDIECYFLKSSTADALTWTFTNSAAPTSMNIHADWSPITGVNTSTGGSNLSVDIVNSVTAAQTLVTGSLTASVNHYARFKIFLKNGTGTSLKIQATNATGVTPLLGSRWTSRRIPTGNTGTFAA